jgi:hypothetical protein
MLIYSIMLEGRDAGRGFLVTLDVAGSSQAHAERLALDEAKNLGLSILGIEEVTLKRKAKMPREAGVIKTYGKAYFQLDEPEC